MTIQQVLDTLDECKPNTFSVPQKIAWLNETDHQVYTDILKIHEGLPSGFVFEGYDQNTPPDKVLLIPDAFAEIYVHALERKIDKENGELDKYNNNTLLFNTRYQEFSDYWTRTHMPLTPVNQFRF